MNTVPSTASSPALLPRLSSRSLPLRLARIVGASLFVAAAAHLAVPLWFTPVPLTLGNLAVVLVGLALGPVEAFAALALYLSEGASGLPVFSPLGPGGVAQLLGATGGFLFAYPLAAALASLIARRAPRRIPGFLTGTLASSAATAVVMALGAAWLGFVLHLAPAKALACGVLPFLPGEVVKIVAAAGLFSALRIRRP